LPAIPMGKTRPRENPWLIFKGDGFEYRVLQAHNRKPDGATSSWYCAVKSPYTFGTYDMGDTYIQSVTDGTVLTYIDPDVPLEALPERVRSQAALLLELK